MAIRVPLRQRRRAATRMHAVSQHLVAGTMRTAKPQSKASSRRIRWPNSWRKAAIGWELPRTFCVLFVVDDVSSKGGCQRIRASSPALRLALKTSA
jgi:hypothetical protein